MFRVVWVASSDVEICHEAIQSVLNTLALKTLCAVEPGADAAIAISKFLKVDPFLKLNKLPLGQRLQMFWSFNRVDVVSMNKSRSDVIGRSARHESGSTHHLLNSAVARFSYPDWMDQPDRHSLTPITPQASWWGGCGTLLHPKDDPACFDASDADLFFDAVGDPRFYVMRIRRRRPVLTTMTRHHRVSQCLGSADAQPGGLQLLLHRPGAAHLLCLPSFFSRSTLKG